MKNFNRIFFSFRNFFTLLLIFLFFTSFAACQQKKEASEGLPDRVTIAYPKSAYSVLFAVAYSKGFFKEEGLEVVPQLNDFGRIAVKSMLEGKADIAISGDTVVMFAVVGGDRIKVIAQAMNSKRNEAIVASTDKGISMPRDLEGKRIGVAFGTTGHFFMDSFLSVNGIEKNSVTIVNMRPSEMISAIKNSLVDAVAVWQPFAKQMERQLGDRGVVFYDERIYSDIVCISTSDEFIKKYPEAVIKVLRGLTAAEEFVKEYPEETRSLASDFLEIDKTILDEIWDTLDFKVVLGQSLIVSLEDQTRWARENKLVESIKTPEYLDYIYIKGLQSVKPDAVILIQ